MLARVGIVVVVIHLFVFFLSLELAFTLVISLAHPAIPVFMRMEGQS